MSNGTPRLTTASFNVERMRSEMLERVAVPAEIVQEAIIKLREKLEAKSTKFFAHRGAVVSQREVVDHEAQLSAVDKILSMAGLYARERDARPAMPTTAIEVDPGTGVVRIVVGAELPPASAAAPSAVLALPGAAQIDDTSVSQSTSRLLEAPVLNNEDKVEILRLRRGRVSEEVKAILFGDGPS